MKSKHLPFNKINPGLDKFQLLHERWPWPGGKTSRPCRKSPCDNMIMSIQVPLQESFCISLVLHPCQDKKGRTREWRLSSVSRGQHTLERGATGVLGQCCPALAHLELPAISSQNLYSKSNLGSKTDIYFAASSVAPVTSCPALDHLEPPGLVKALI